MGAEDLSIRNRRHRISVISTELCASRLCVETAVDHREDKDYWVGKAPEHPTFRLRLIMESDGNGLTAEDLLRFGFKGGQSLRHYIHHNTELLEYIESMFE